jgi:hypothetical protein
VRAILNKEKCWNEEIQKYVFVNPYDSNKVMIVSNQEVEFEPTPYLYRTTDRMDYFDSITITTIK